MKIYNSLIILLSLFLQNLSAKNAPETFQMPRLVYAGDFSCNLSAPSTLTVNAVGSDWVEVSWPAVIGAAQYRLQAYDGILGDGLGNAVFVAGSSTSATISTAGNGGSVYVRIWSVCENGDYNANNYTQSTTVDTIIIDIVASGFTMPAYNTTTAVGVGPTNGVNVSWTGDYEYFNVQYTNGGNPYGRRFALFVKANSSPDRVMIPMGEQGNTNEHIVFLTENDAYGNPVRLTIRFREDLNTPPASATVLTKLSASFAGGANTTGKWFKTVLGDPNCIVEKTSWSSGVWGFNAGPTTSNTAFSSDPVKAKPNPFTNNLIVELPTIEHPSETTLHLYDIMGVRRMTYQVPVGQTECTLQTAEFQPGVYFLHLESDGKLAQLKLVKTQ